ncbi:hypothetical protein [Cystobacter fuscus]|uniref:hypothetical protein n=1 Tax=Cystobacter fuscus TaxID=43 RepID=UPI002B30D703|nr:hypothetical protein F0U63_02725 [Cystobacter fuscus]
MHQYRMKSWVGSLLVGLLGVGCGGALETPPAPSPLPVAARESKLCAELGVTTLTLTGSNTQQGELAGSGSWAVSGPANGVRLEYYVDDVLYAVEEQPGKSGTWYFSRTGVSCGVLHPIQVKAWPMLIDGDGVRGTCTSGSKTVSKADVGEECVGNLPCERCHVSGAIRGRSTRALADHCPRGALDEQNMMKLLERARSGEGTARR